jgi:hypothetical protein
MKPVKDMTQLEIGALVCTHLANKGMEVVLSGGASVSLYTHNKYLSKDLDFIQVVSIGRQKLKKAMGEIGFFEESRYFRHPDSKFIVEFPPGPLSIGEEPIKQIIEKKLSTGLLKVISATDCVKDRLAAYYHWGDKQSLSQATLVVQNNKKDVDLKEIERWSRAEGKLEEFEKLRSSLTGKLK